VFSDETLSVKCEDPQSGKVNCTFRWQQPAGRLLKPAYEDVTPEFNVTCPAESSTKNVSDPTDDLIYILLQKCTNWTSDGIILILIFLSAQQSTMMSNNLVATSQVSFPAVLFDCPLMCQANMCLRKENSKDSDCLYMRRGSFTSRSAREYFSVQFLIIFRVNIIYYVIATCVITCAFVGPKMFEIWKLANAYIFGHKTFVNNT